MSLLNGKIFNKAEVIFLFRELSIIMLVSLVAEGIRIVLPFPIPSSIYGLILLFLLLNFKIIKPKQIKKTADFLLSLMPIMFVPAGVGIMESFSAIKPFILPILLCVSLSTAIVMLSSALISQSFIRRGKK